jgi:hypothetical protein
MRKCTVFMCVYSGLNAAQRTAGVALCIADPRVVGALCVTRGERSLRLFIEILGMVHSSPFGFLCITTMHHNVQCTVQGTGRMHIIAGR